MIPLAVLNRLRTCAPLKKSVRSPCLQFSSISFSPRRNLTEGQVNSEASATANENSDLSDEIISKVNRQISESSHGRLFAVVYIKGRQHLVTGEDLLVVDHYFPPQTGDKIRLEKVMMVGSRDFSLFGRPLLPPDLVNIEATVVEKRLEATRIKFRYFKKILNFERLPLTYLRISKLEISHPVDDLPSIQGIEGRTF